MVVPKSIDYNMSSAVEAQIKQALRNDKIYNSIPYRYCTH